MSTNFIIIDSVKNPELFSSINEKIFRSKIRYRTDQLEFKMERLTKASFLDYKKRVRLKPHNVME